MEMNHVENMRNIVIGYTEANPAFNVLLKAFDLAAEKHKDQKDKAGEPYMNHVAKVFEVSMSYFISRVALGAKVVEECYESESESESFPGIGQYVREEETLRHLLHQIWENKIRMAIVGGCVALLHDIVEDGHVELSYIKEEFGDYVYNAIEILTKKKEDTYEEYIEKVKKELIPRIVKFSDLINNSDEVRLSKLDEETRMRLSVKYSNALESLKVFSYEE